MMYEIPPGRLARGLLTLGLLTLGLLAVVADGEGRIAPHALRSDRPCYDLHEIEGIQMKYLLVILLALSFTGCASSDEYVRYLDAQAQIATAKANAETERYRAMATIAQSGDSAVKVGAMFALQEQGRATAAPSHGIAPPKSWAENLASFAPILTPFLHLGTTWYQVKAQMRASDNATALGIRQSDNATTLGVSTNQAFTGMANAQGTQAAAGFTALNTLGQTGMVNLGNTANSLGAHIQSPQPNVTISGTGVVGSGSASTLSGTGVLGSGSYSTSDLHPNTITTTNTNDNHSVTTDDHTYTGK